MDFNVDNFNFEGHENRAVGIEEGRKWAYPAMAYNSKDGRFITGSDDDGTLEELPSLLGVQVLAVRKSKYVEQDGLTVGRFPVFTAKAAMPWGNVRYHTQALIVWNGEIHVLGAKSMTARASISNPKGKYAIEGIDAPIVETLNSLRKLVKEQKQIDTSYFSFVVDLVPTDDQIVVGSSQPQKVYPFEVRNPRSADADAAAEAMDLFENEDIAGWIAEWGEANTTMLDALEAQRSAEDEAASAENLGF